MQYRLDLAENRVMIIAKAINLQPQKAKTNKVTI